MPLSAAMQRFELPDKKNPWFAKFKYSKVHGVGYEKGIVRRDTSSIIEANGKYYIWYTRAKHPCTPVGHERQTDLLPAHPWDLADVWYATSSDGHHWGEQGPAVQRGPAGAYDERSVFTPGILAHEGRYYLVLSSGDFTQPSQHARIDRDRLVGFARRTLDKKPCADS